MFGRDGHPSTIVAVVVVIVAIVVIAAAAAAAAVEVSNYEEWGGWAGGMEIKFRSESGMRGWVGGGCGSGLAG